MLVDSRLGTERPNEAWHHWYWECRQRHRTCAVTRGSAREIVLVNRTQKAAEAVATDLRCGIPLGRRIDISHGNYGAGVVLITSGVNEKTGGATDRSDPQGRLRLLEKNAAIYRDIVPKIVHGAPDAVLIAVSDPPDPLADIARKVAGHDRVLMFLHEDDPNGSPLGSKGIGELGICGAGAAVINAIHNATGTRIHKLPATPDKLLAALDLLDG
jgi:hypothetical protein